MVAVKVHPQLEYPPVPGQRATLLERVIIAQAQAGSSMVMGAAVVLERMPDHAGLSGILEGIARKHWRLRAIVQKDRWASKDFKLEDHVIVHKEHKGESFEDFASRELAVPLDLSDSLWQVHLVRGQWCGEDRCLCLMKIHHVVCDAMAFASVILEATAERENGEVKAASQRVLTAKHREWWWYLTWIVWAPFYVLSVACMMRDREIGLRACRPPPTKSEVRCSRCWCCRRRVAQKKRCFISPTFSLDDIKRAGKGAGSGSVTGTALSVVAAAINDYGRELGSTKPADLKLVCPVTYRSKRQKELDNQSLGFVMKAPGAQEDDVKRLKSSIARMTTAKRSPAFVMNYVMLAATLAILPTSWCGWFQDHYASKISFLLSSIPGPSAPLSLAGVPLLAVYGFVPPIGDIPICLSMFTMSGNLFFGMQADENLPDPTRIWKHYETRLGKLKDAMGIIE